MPNYTQKISSRCCSKCLPSLREPTALHATTRGPEAWEEDQKEKATEPTVGGVQRQVNTNVSTGNQVAHEEKCRATDPRGSAVTSKGLSSAYGSPFNQSPVLTLLPLPWSHLNNECKAAAGSSTHYIMQLHLALLLPAHSITAFQPSLACVRCDKGVLRPLQHHFVHVLPHFPALPLNPNLLLFAPRAQGIPQDH